jgi:Na+/H+ antiporter NhaD/arsenite permease-like protein
MITLALLRGVNVGGHNTVPMAALRETSIVFGAVLAAFVLREPFGLKRGVLALALACALSLLQLA